MEAHIAPLQPSFSLREELTSLHEAIFYARALQN
jgi:hypothetical protein